MSGRVHLMPSILNADWTRIGEQVREAEAAGVDAISLDVMDGDFVPPITFGAGMVEAVRRVTDLPLEAHLMVRRPERHVQDFVEAGANIVTIHVESTEDPRAVVEQIQALDAEAGVTLNPDTALGLLDPLLPVADRVQVMSVVPGWGGQSFMPDSLQRIVWVRERLQHLGRALPLCVDGGINAETAPAAVSAGADWLVAGSAIYNERSSVADGVARLREALSVSA